MVVQVFCKFYCTHNWRIMVCSFSKEISKNGYTAIENAFISEYMPIASSDSVKVYLYGLFLCNNKNIETNLTEFAKFVALEEKTVLDCFAFWEELGLVSVLSKEPLNIQFLPVKEAYYSKPKKYKPEKYADFTKGLQVMLPSRMVSTHEYAEYFNIMDSYHIKSEAMLLIVKYCIDKKGEDINYKYVSKVAKDFGDREINTLEKVEKELSSYVLRTAEIEKILKALSSKRKPDIDDLNLYKKWTQELNFESENIIFAASKLKKSSMEKLDEFILKLYANKSFSKEEIAGYLSSRQQVCDLAIKINKALAIYVEVLDTEIDNYITKWLSYGFDEQALLYVASIQFKNAKNTLSDMDEVIEYLRKRGFVSSTSVNDYFESIKASDEFIKKILVLAGVNRRPTPWDRENLEMWRGWNFSEEMILEASKLSVGKSNPIAYINGILSNWKNSNIFNLDDLSNQEQSSNVNSQEEYNREYERRREIAVSRATKNNEIAMAIDGVSNILSRLSSIEKDLAFAEIASNNQALQQFEEEKNSLIEKANLLLSTKGLTLEDLSPRYMCEKCKDTGYVGTHKCDCFEKYKTK